MSATEYHIDDIKPAADKASDGPPAGLCMPCTKHFVADEIVPAMRDVMLRAEDKITDGLEQTIGRAPTDEEIAEHTINVGLAAAYTAGLAAGINAARAMPRKGQQP